MLLFLDLTTRQAARVLEQALREHASFQFELRAVSDRPEITATFGTRAANLLAVDVLNPAEHAGLIDLIGSYCDVSLSLSGQRYLFVTCIVDIPADAQDKRVLMAIPETIQVVNRRRFERTNATIASQVRLWLSPDDTPHVGLLASVSGNGLAADLPGTEADDKALLGDEVRVAFELAGFDELYELPAIVCNKALDKRRGQVQLGLEFLVKPDDSAAGATLERLRASLAEMTVDLSDGNG